MQEVAADYRQPVTKPICTCAETDGQRCPIPLHQPVTTATGALRTLLLEMLEMLANAEHGACFCRSRMCEFCAAGDCDACPECPSGKARSILVSMGLA